MTDQQVGMLMLGLFIFIIMLGFPIAFTLMAMGVAFGYYAYFTPGQDFFQNRIFTLLVQKAFEVSSSDVLTAIPLFLFMGYVVERANILDRLFHSLQISMKNRKRVMLDLSGCSAGASMPSGDPLALVGSGGAACAPPLAVRPSVRRGSGG